MGGSAMSPEPLDESPEIGGSAHDKSHCRYRFYPAAANPKTFEFTTTTPALL
jgi:hypothetical protein